MRRFIMDTKAKGAVPIVLSLTVRNIWKDDKVERGSGRFNEWAAEVARNEHVSFVDVTRIIAGWYERMGEATVKKFFPEDYAHTTAQGAEVNASAVIAGLKTLPGAPFAALLSAKAAAVEPARDRGMVLIGDSTVRNGSGDGRNGQWGWGER